MAFSSRDYSLTGSPDPACYTSPFPSMLRTTAQPGSPIRAGFVFFAWWGRGQRSAILIAVLFLGTNCLAQQEAPSPWQAAADDFVQQIVSRSGSLTAITLNFGNLSSLPAGEQAAIRQIMMTDFRNAGVRLVKADFAQSQVDITFSEDWQGYVWVAEIKQGAGAQVVVKRVPRPQRSAALRTPNLAIKKTLVWQQDTSILDFYSDGPNLLLLEPDQITFYINEGGKWRVRQTLAITHEHPWPRDLRGRLVVNGFQISAFLPGTLCTGTTTPPFMQCRAGDDPWQIDPASLAAFFSPNRNFFTGVLAGRSAGESVPPFFSAAAMQIGGSRQWVFAGTDGRARIFLNNTSAAGIVVNDWGSQVAAVQSGCGSGWQMLATAPTDLNRMDSVQAFEIDGHQEVPVSTTTDLPGAVLAFWPGENPQTAHIVLQSPVTGKFEAWSVAVTCN